MLSLVILCWSLCHRLCICLLVGQAMSHSVSRVTSISECSMAVFSKVTLSEWVGYSDKVLGQLRKNGGNLFSIKKRPHLRRSSGGEVVQYHKILLNWYQCLILNNKSWSFRWFWAKASTTSWPASWRVFETMTSASSWATSMKAGQGWGHKPVAAVGDGILFPLFLELYFATHSTRRSMERRYSGW